MGNPRNYETMPTTAVEQPFEVWLDTVSPRWPTADRVIVSQHVLHAGRRIVRADVGYGYWYVPDYPGPNPKGAIPVAVFEPDTAVRFSFRAG